MRSRFTTMLIIATLSITSACGSDDGGSAAEDDAERTQGYCEVVQELEEVITSDRPAEERLQEGLTLYGEATTIMPEAIRDLQYEPGDPDAEELQADIDAFNLEECGVDTAALGEIIAELQTAG